MNSLDERDIDGERSPWEDVLDMCAELSDAVPPLPVNDEKKRIMSAKL